MTRFILPIFTALLLFYQSVTFAATSKEINIGILAYLPNAQMEKKYQPLADYLEQKLGDRQVNLIPLNYDGDEIEKAIESHQLDLLFTNPSHFIKLRTHYKLSGAILTKVVMRNGIPLSAFGGVIFTQADNRDINTLSDIANKHIAAADPRSLGGYQAQVYEALTHDVKLKHTTYLNKHNTIVETILAGKADVGFVRSGVLENMMQKGQLQRHQIKIIHQQENTNFPFILSTRLYPEWPVLALPRLSSEDVRLVASALLTLDEKLPAAKAAKIGGFDPPADYLPVEELVRSLRLPPYDKAPAFTLADIWSKHQLALILLLFTFVIISTLSIVIHRKNRSLIRNRESLRQAASVFTHTREGIIITDANASIININKAFETITGYSKKEVLGQNPSMLKSGIQTLEFYQAMWKRLQTEHNWQGEVSNRRKNGEVYTELLTIDAIYDSKNNLKGYVGLFSDITLQKEQQKALEHLAHYDALTGLPNRIVFNDRLQQAIKLAHRHGQTIAVVYIDLDGFKEINDNYGHHIGDKILTETALRMQSVLREGDTVARLGGDEFVALLLEMSPNEEEEICHRLLSIIKSPIQIDNHELGVSASIGVSLYSHKKPIHSNELVNQADQSMYAAKHNGKNQFVIFNQGE